MYLLATTTLPLASASLRPSSRSDSPPPYISAVSKKLSLASNAA